MDLETVILSEVSQTQKDKYYIILLICRIFLKSKNELIYKTEIDNKCKCRKRTYGSQTIRKEGRDKLEDWD